MSDVVNNISYDKGGKLGIGFSRNLIHSRIIDVHKASDHPEVNSFVDSIFNEYLYFDDMGTRSRNNNKKHLKLLLLDLYLGWCTDPSLYIGVHMSENAYSKGIYRIRRYNDLWIKGTLPQIIRKLREVGMTPEEIADCDSDHLFETGLIGFRRGYNTGRAVVSRIWATNKLIEMFENARFGEFDIGYSKNRETVLLNEWFETEEEVTIQDEHGFDETKIIQTKKKEFIDYKSTLETERMSEVLRDYNALLEKSFIDIGELKIPRVQVGERNSKRKDEEGNDIYLPVYVNITHHSKFTRRIFNNGSFKQGGRFYGGWWQRLKGDLRKDILIDGTRTVEIDFSGLHPNLAYTRQGLDYSGTDPYDIQIEAFAELGINDPSVSREVIKLMMLLALNAPDETSLFKAFRNEFDYSFLGGLPFRFTNEQLSKILKSIKEEHHPIADQFASNAGIDLMYLDSLIVEDIIKIFIAEGEPVLQVFDSFIVKFWQEDLLRACMHEAFQATTGRSKIKMKQNDNLTLGWVNNQMHLDREAYLDRSEIMRSPKLCTGYLNRLNRHNKHYANKDAQQGRPMFVPDEIIEPKKYKKYKDRQNN